MTTTHELIEAIDDIDTATCRRNALVKRLLDEGWSTRRLAKVANVAHTTVIKWRDAA